MRNLLRTEKQHRHPSLFGEIADWLLAPFLILWPLSMALEYALAFSVASGTYDRDLKDSVVALATLVSTEESRVRSAMTPSAAAILHAHGADETLYQVRDPEQAVIDGAAALPAVRPAEWQRAGEVYFRNEQLDGRDVRVAYLFVEVPGAAAPALIQIAETEGKRVQLASDISGAVFTAQLLLLPAVLLLVWFGLSTGFAGLDDIRRTIRERKPEDLSPIDAQAAPEEVRPFIVSINELMMRLDMSLKAQQRFVADAAHQMRTPLAGLKTQAELALRQHDKAGIEYSIRQIAAGADRASRLINQLLALARADSDAPPPLARIELQALAQETTREWFERAVDKRIDLGFEGMRGVCHVEGNAILLRELLNNLLDNAIRYTRSGGRVTVRISTARSIVLEVEDDGIGIDPRERDLVFERFYRVLGTEGEGSGLGLAIVREIADLHGARVGADANPAGAGTVVRVEFPAGTSATVVPLRTAA